MTKRDQGMWMGIAGIGTLAALVVWGLTGCAAQQHRVEVREQWSAPLSTQYIDILGKDNRRLLRVSPDGRIWEWDGTSEEIVSMLIESMGKQQASFVQYQKEMEAKLKSALEPKKEEVEKEAEDDGQN